MPLRDDDPVHGIGWVLFGVGMNGAGWLGRLGRSTWFVGLEPRPEDLSAGSGVVCGSWAMPPDASLADEPAVAAEAEAFFAAAPVPQGWCAAIAVPRGIGPAETGAALGLTDALRARRDPLGRRLTVVVTIEEETGPLAGVLVRRLSDRGAFVVNGR